MLRLFNSLTQKKEIFKPFAKNKVSIYVCGITPYDTTHLGHAFVYVSFDALIRYLKYKGLKVNYTQNVTDIDDDLLKKAKEAGKNWIELGKFWTDRFLKDLKALNVLPPTHYIKATDSIPEMIKIINGLLGKGYAYRKNGNVYFNVSKAKDYGKLSKYSNSQMKLLLKERGGDPDDPNKINPLDFILWQKSKLDEPSWGAPFGDGRPGWHIECSAMIKQYLGDQIDIHGGGKDLIYPHHESEIAQSESYAGKIPFSKFFMHIAMVMSCGEKMSKSLGNLIMIKDLLKIYSANTIRWYLLSYHYRSPWEYMEVDLGNIKNKILKIKNVLKLSNGRGKILKNYTIDFEKIMNDDLNTPRALEFLSTLAKKIEKNVKKDQDEIMTLISLLKLLGFDFKA